MRTRPPFAPSGPRARQSVEQAFIVGLGLSLFALPGLIAQASASSRIAPPSSPPMQAATELTSCPDELRGHAARARPAPDLHCIPLLPTARAPSATGALHLLPGDTPFGAAVDRDGVVRHRFRAVLDGLPDPASLGPYDRYVVWITPPTLHPMVRLGEATDGVTELGEGGFNSFLVMISAEGPEVGGEREGPLVLRGSSPSMVLRPHDLPFILAEMAAPPHHPPEHGPGAHEPDAADRDPPHHDHAATPTGLASPGWRPPPMHPEVQMPHELMALRPGVSALLPTGETGSGDEPPAPLARPRETIHLVHGDTLRLEAGPVTRRIGRLELPGYGFNGQIPGPLIRAAEGSTVHIAFGNRTPLPTAIHWHGIRLDNAFDGVPGVTQDPIAPGGAFDYELRLPDEGTFWYHPHLREDVMQDLGLAGNIQVTPPREADPYAPVDREEFLLLDDHLVGPDGPVPYGLEAPIHAFMGRFGNRLLVNGEEAWELEVRPGEVVRFHLTNAANTRTFNLSFEEAPMKLVAGDLGKLPEELFVESVVIAPAERWVVDVRFPDAGAFPLQNRVQAIDHMGGRFFSEVHELGAVRVTGDGMEEGRPASRAFDTLRRAPAIARELDALVEEWAARPPDRTLELSLHAGGLPFPLDPLIGWEGVYRPQVEWSGTMPDMDWLATGAEVEWILRDPATGLQNMEIDWRFEQGELVRLRVVNDRDSLHPMQHPIHIHGQRFLVLSVNGEPHPYPTWKDTVLVPVGQVVELLVEMSNPGAWMLHCHIAEHMETGMMSVFHVEPGGPSPAETQGADR